MQENEIKFLAVPERQVKLMLTSSRDVAEKIVALITDQLRDINVEFTAPRQVLVNDRYYDTVDEELLASGAYFRVRKSGDQIRAYIKIGSHSSASGTYSRPEFRTSPLSEESLRVLQRAGFVDTLGKLENASTSDLVALRSLFGKPLMKCLLVIDNVRTEVEVKSLHATITVDRIAYSSADGALRGKSEQDEEIEVEIEYASPVPPEEFKPLQVALVNAGFVPSGAAKVLRGLDALRLLDAINKGQLLLDNPVYPKAFATAVVSSLDHTRVVSRHLDRLAVECVVLFADLTSSVRYRFESRKPLHDSIVRSYAHNNLCKLWVAACGGQLVKELGDGVMAVFPGDAAKLQAVRAAIGIVRSISEIRELNQPELVGIESKVAITSGYIVRQGHGQLDFFGLGVDLAARLLGNAQPGEVLAATSVCGPIFDRLQKSLDVSISDRLCMRTKEDIAIDYHLIKPAEEIRGG